MDEVQKTIEKRLKNRSRYLIGDEKASKWYGRIHRVIRIHRLGLLFFLTTFSALNILYELDYEFNRFTLMTRGFAAYIYLVVAGNLYYYGSLVGPDNRQELDDWLWENGKKFISYRIELNFATAFFPLFFDTPPAQVLILFLLFALLLSFYLIVYFIAINPRYFFNTALTVFANGLFYLYYLLLPVAYIPLLLSNYSFDVYLVSLVLSIIGNGIFHWRARKIMSGISYGSPLHTFVQRFAKPHLVLKAVIEKVKLWKDDLKYKEIAIQILRKVNKSKNETRNVGVETELLKVLTEKYNSSPKPFYLKPLPIIFLLIIVRVGFYIFDKIFESFITDLLYEPNKSKIFELICEYIKC